MSEKEAKELVSPMRRASELGCVDFDMRNGQPLAFKTPDVNGNPILWMLPSMPVINRYAAAVCAEWWHKRSWEAADKVQERYMCEQYASQARAFGAKYGNPRN